LRIERVDVADASAHEQRNHRRGSRFEMRRFGCVGIEANRLGLAGGACVAAVGGQQFVLVQQICQRQSAHAAAGAKEKITPRPAGFHDGHLMYTNSFTFNSTWVRSTSDWRFRESSARPSSV